MIKTLSTLLLGFFSLGLLAGVAPALAQEHNVNIPFAPDDVGLHDFNAGVRDDITDNHGGVNKGHLVIGEGLNAE